MPVYFKNATVDVRLPVGQGDAGSAEQRRVHIQPASATVAYEQFGVDVANTHLLMDEPDAIDYYAEFGRVIWNSKEYAIIASPKLWDHHPAAAHIEVLIKEVRLIAEAGETPLLR